jgi:hypothetical protein
MAINPTMIMDTGVRSDRTAAHEKAKAPESRGLFARDAA